MKGWDLWPHQKNYYSVAGDSDYEASISSESGSFFRSQDHTAKVHQDGLRAPFSTIKASSTRSTSKPFPRHNNNYVIHLFRFEDRARHTETPNSSSKYAGTSKTELSTFLHKRWLAKIKPKFCANVFAVVWAGRKLFLEGQRG